MINAVTEKTNIGVFGGSFDPPHIGHLITARFAAEQYHIKKILLMPVSIQPHKPDGPRSSANDRLEMVQAIATLDDLFEVEPCEVKRGGVSYTVDTLSKLRERYSAKDFRLFWILGWDAALDFPNWRNPEEITQLCELIVLPRDGKTLADLPATLRGHFKLADSPMIEISSTMIRERVRAGFPVRVLVGEKVMEIIRKRGLYR